MQSHQGLGSECMNLRGSQFKSIRVSNAQISTKPCRKMTHSQATSINCILNRVLTRFENKIPPSATNSNARKQRKLPDQWKAMKCAWARIHAFQEIFGLKISSLITTMNKWNLKLIMQYNLHQQPPNKIHRHRSNKICKRSIGGKLQNSDELNKK